LNQINIFGPMAFYNFLKHKFNEILFSYFYITTASISL
jgi:hypothetical protein